MVKELEKDRSGAPPSQGAPIPATAEMSIERAGVPSVKGQTVQDGSHDLSDNRLPWRKYLAMAITVLVTPFWAFHAHGMGKAIQNLMTGTDLQDGLPNFANIAIPFFLLFASLGFINGFESFYFRRRKQIVNGAQQDDQEKEDEPDQASDRLFPRTRRIHHPTLEKSYDNAIKRLEQISNKRTAVSSLFSTVHASLIGGLFLVTKDLLIDQYSYAAMLPILVAPPLCGFLLSIGWLVIVDYYSGEQEEKLELIRKLESRLSVRPFEYEIARKPNHGYMKPGRDFTHFAMPVLFAGIYYGICASIVAPPTSDVYNAYLDVVFIVVVTSIIVGAVLLLDIVSKVRAESYFCIVVIGSLALYSSAWTTIQRSQWFADQQIATNRIAADAPNAHHPEEIEKFQVVRMLLENIKTRKTN